MKLVYQFNWRTGAGQSLVQLVETAGRSAAGSFEAPAEPAKLWLRLVKRRQRLRITLQRRRQSVHRHGKAEWGDGGPKQIGLLAKTAGGRSTGGRSRKSTLTSSSRVAGPPMP